MRNLTILIMILLVSCSKKDSQVTKDSQKDQLSSCSFGMNAFNKSKRALVEEPYARSKPVKGNPALQPVSMGMNAAILLVFDGEEVSNTMWNNYASFTCAPANLYATEIDKIVERVSEDFSPFNVVVTTDPSIYNTAHPQKRMKVIITESWEWFGMAGGIAYDHSFLWGNNTPCFVFSSLLHYNEKFIAEAISHELGHTFGLKHHSSFTNSCSFLQEYNSGAGNGITGWAPIMGNSYYQNVTTWHSGPTTNCGTVQNDLDIIGGILGLRADELDKMNKSPLLSGTLEGMINFEGDEDYFEVDIKGNGTIQVVPHCIGNGEGANLNLKINVYRKNGTLLTSASDPNALSAIVNLAPGKYYIGIETEAQTHQSKYGMVGRYLVSLL